VVVASVIENLRLAAEGEVISYPETTVLCVHSVQESVNHDQRERVVC
jgi:hypothetical protein